MHDGQVITARRPVVLLVAGLPLTLFGLTLVLPGALDAESDAVMIAVAAMVAGPVLLLSFFRTPRMTPQRDRLLLRLPFGPLELAWQDVEELVIDSRGRLGVLFRNGRPPKGWVHYVGRARGGRIPGVWRESGTELAALLVPYWAAATGRPATSPRVLTSPDPEALKLAAAEAKSQARRNKRADAAPRRAEKLKPRWRWVVTLLLIPFGLMSLLAITMLMSPFRSPMASAGGYLLLVMGLPFIGLLLLRGRMPSLVLDEGGLTLRSLSIGRQRLRWSEVGRFSAEENEVRCSFTRGAAPNAFWEKRACGSQVRLSGAWKLQGEHLAALLNERRAAALAR